MTAVTAIVSLLGDFAPTLLGALWRASIDGVLFALPAAGICRLVPRLPAATRFWLWWLVSAKLLLGLVLGVVTLPIKAPLVVRLPAHHPAAAPAFFVARLAVQPAHLFSPNSAAGAAAAPKAPLAGTVSGDRAHSGQQSADSQDKAAPSVPGQAETAETAALPQAPAMPNPWRVPATFTALIWCAGFSLNLRKSVAGILATCRSLQGAVPVSAAVHAEAISTARLMGLRRLPRIREQNGIASPFLAGFLRPVVVLPAPAEAALTSAELRMALAHELTHLRRGDLWLALIPTLAQTAFFFLPIARWAARECDTCREEACDSAAITLFGDKALADYGQLLLKVTLASQASGQAAPQMGMAVTVSPAFRQLRRRLNSLRQAAVCPTSPRRRRGAAVLLTVCLPGLLPWHLRALPRSALMPTEPTDAALADRPQYDVVDLGTLGGKFSDAYGIGDDGTVVGTANVFPLGGRGHAFLWRPTNRDTDTTDTGDTGKMADLCEGSIFRHSLAYGVNEAGQVAAAAFNNSSKPSAFVWMPGAGSGTKQRRYIGTLTGYRYSRATGINNAGVVVGVALDTGTDRRGATRMRAFTWQKGQIRDLGTLGGPFSAASAVSQAGHVAGKSDTRAVNGYTTHAALWEPGSTEAHDLGTLPGGGNSAASAVNAFGQAVGYSETLGTPRRAFLYTNGAMEDLGVLPTAVPDSVAISVAGGINDAGYIVGASASLPAASVRSSGAPLSLSRAVLWLPGSPAHPQRHLIDLNRCLDPDTHWTLESARAINNRGEIVGVGRIGGKRHAFLLKPRSTADNK